MKNLKRALSLALASVMVLGMMVVGAGAVEFNDVEDIVNVDAVNTMTALGVLKGKDTGDFDPEGIVTRAEMAKIICVMLSGGKEPNLGTSTAAYPDTANHWANSYIAYCANLDIVAGDNHGNFNPDATVTGTEAAKMLLVAMGFDSDVFTFTGATWAINVNTQANKARLYDDVETSATEGLSRDNAAQMAFNATSAFIMEKTYDKMLSNGEISYNYELSTTTTFLNEYFDAKTFVGTFDGNNNTGHSPKGEIEVYGRLDTDPEFRADGVTSNNRKADFPSDLDISYIGEQFKIIFKDGKGGTDNRPDKNDTIYGVFNTGAVTVYNITKGDLQDAGTDTLGKGKIKFGDELYDMAALAAGTTAIVKNYGAGADVTANTIGGGVAGCTAAQFASYINTAANGLRLRSADPIKFVTNTNGEIVKAYVENWTYTSVLSVSDKKVQLEGIGSKDLEDVKFVDDVDEDDLVAVATFYSNVPQTQVKAAASIQGTVDAISGTKLKIDGVWYNRSDNNETEVLGDYDIKLGFAVGDEYELVLDGETYYVVGKTITANVDYALVLKAQDGINPQVKLMLADGTTTTYIINSDSKLEYSHLAGVRENATAMLVEYELVKNGTQVKMTAVDTVTDNASGATHTYNKDTKVLTTRNGSNVAATHIASNNAVAFVYSTNTGKWKAYNANTISTVGATDNSQAQWAIAKSGSKVQAFTLISTAAPTGAADATAYGYVTDVVRTKVNDDDVVELSVWNGTETVTVVVEGRSTPAAAGKGNFIKYPISSAPVASSEVVAGDNATAKVKEYDATRKLVITSTGQYALTGSLIGGTETVYKVDSDTQIIGVKSADTEGSDYNAITPHNKVFTKDFDNVHIIYELDGTTRVIKAIFVDEDNVITQANGSTSGAGTKYTVADATVTADNGQTATVTADKTEVVAGETITYTVTVSGKATVNGKLTMAPDTNSEVVDNGITVVSGDVAIVNTDGTTVYFAKNATSAVIKFTVTAKAADVGPATFTFADGHLFDVTAATVTAGTSATPVNNAYLTVTTDKTHIISGDTVTYTVTIHGDVTAASKITLTPGTNATITGCTITGDTANVTHATNATSGVVNIASGNGDTTVVTFTVTGTGAVASSFALANQ